MIEHGILKSHDIFHMYEKMSLVSEDTMCKGCRGGKQMSFIPPKCLQCGDPLSRKSTINPDLRCVGCNREFTVTEVTQL